MLALLIVIAITSVGIMGSVSVLVAGVLTGTYHRNRLAAHTGALAVLEQYGTRQAAATDGSDLVLINTDTKQIVAYEQGSAVPSGSILLRRSWSVQTSGAFQILRVSAQRVQPDGYTPTRDRSNQEPVVVTRTIE